MFLGPLLERYVRRRFHAIGIHSHSIQTSAGLVHAYEMAGDENIPTLVLLHGFGASAASFAQFMVAIQPSVGTVWLPEAPGHGFSRHQSTSLTIDAVYDGWREFLVQLAPRPLILFGNSMGGAIAIRYALDHPEYVHGLFLSSPAGAFRDVDEFERVTATFQIRSSCQAEDLLQRLYHRAPRLRYLFVPDVLRKYARSNSPFRQCLMSFTPGHLFRPEELQSLHMPVHLEWGKSEKLLPYSCLEFMRAHLPAHVTIEEPEGVGHCPNLEEPAKLAQRVARFVRKLAS